MKNVLLFAGLALVSTALVADEVPPVDSLSLSEVVQSLENQGYSPITEISMENGVWEAEVYKGQDKRELRLNPLNAKILSDRPDY